MNLLQTSAEEMQSYIADTNIDLWKDTPFAGYVFMSNKNKGSFGERLLELIWLKQGHKVEPPTNAGHDRIVNGKKREIKFSLAMTNRKDNKINDYQFIMNHVSAGKDWDELYFYGINSDLSTIEILLTKQDFLDILEDENQPYFKSQQGGKKIGNDDYICSGKGLLELYESSWNRI